MTAWIIGPTNTQTNTITGYTAGAGLSFGVGLILGFAGFTGIQFNGSGSEVVTNTIAAQRNSAVYAGTGSLSAAQFGIWQTNPATLGGIGSLSDPFTGVTRPSNAIFAGTGSLQGNVIKAINAIFAGIGNVSALPSGRYVTNPVTFSGSGTLLPTVSLVMQASVTFAGTGGNSVRAYP